VYVPAPANVAVVFSEFAFENVTPDPLTTDQTVDERFPSASVAVPVSDTEFVGSCIVLSDPALTTGVLDVTTTAVHLAYNVTLAVPVKLAPLA